MVRTDTFDNNCHPLFDVSATFEQCKSKFGAAPDVFVNCAGIAGETNWEKVYDINVVRSTF